MQQEVQTDEKRRHKRFVVEGIHGNLLFAATVSIVNMSMGGAAIETDRRLNIGSDYNLKLEDHGKFISTKCTVVWAVIAEGRKGQRGEVVPVYRVGLEFKEVLTEKAQELGDFIEDHKRVIEGRLAGVRFKIHAPERAVLSSLYLVRKISMGGMLIESGQPFSVGETPTMEMNLPHEKQVRFSGRVTSCVESEGLLAKHYNIGVAFGEMSEEDKESLKRFIETLYA